MGRPRRGWSGSLSDHKPHAPTARRLREARRAGQVARSEMLSGALVLLAGLLAAPRVVRGIERCFREGLAPGAWSLSAANVAAALPARVLGIVWPLLLAVLGAGLLGGVVQTGLRFTPRAPGRRPAALAALWSEGLVNLLGAGLLLGLASLLLWHHARDLLAALGRSPTVVAGLLAALARRLGWAVVLGGLAVGAVQLVDRRRRLLACLRMSRAELEEERRQELGSPLARRATRERSSAPL